MFLEFLYEYGLFLAQAVTLTAAILIIVGGIVSMTQRQRSEMQEGHIEIRNQHGLPDITFLSVFRIKARIHLL